MSARRNWYFSTAAIAALLFGLDAAAQKYGQGLPKFPDFKPAGPELRGPPAGIVPGLTVKGPAPGLDGNMPATPNRDANSGGSPSLSDPPGQGGTMPAKSNKGGGHDSSPGKDKPDAPGENVQANAGDVIPQARPLHKIPTCQ